MGPSIFKSAIYFNDLLFLSRLKGTCIFYYELSYFALTSSTHFLSFNQAQSMSTKLKTKDSWVLIHSHVDDE